MYPGNPFDRPTSAALIIVEGLDTVASSELSFPLKAPEDRAAAFRSLLTGEEKTGATSVSSLVSEKIGIPSISVSACSTAAHRASVRDVSSAEAHTIFSTDGHYADQVDNGKALVFQPRSTGAFADSVLKGQDAKLLDELHTMVSVAQQFKGAGVFNFNVVQYKNVLSRHAAGSTERAAATAAVDQALAMIKQALGEALVVAVALDIVVVERTVSSMESWIINQHATGRGRRGATTYGQKLAGVNRTEGNLGRNW